MTSLSKGHDGHQTKTKIHVWLAGGFWHWRVTDFLDHTVDHGKLSQLRVNRVDVLEIARKARDRYRKKIRHDEKRDKKKKLERLPSFRDRDFEWRIRIHGDARLKNSSFYRRKRFQKEYGIMRDMSHFPRKIVVDAVRFRFKNPSDEKAAA